MTRPDHPSLLQRALGVFVVFAVLLGLFLWAGKSFLQRPVDRVYLDARRLAALRTFESAIVPLSSLPGYQQPAAVALRSQFEFCDRPLREQRQAAIPERELRTNPCANASAPEELACYLQTINAKLGELAGEKPGDKPGDQGKRRDRMLAQRYVVSVEKWADAVRTTQQQTHADNAKAARDPGKSEAVTCRDAVGAARQLAAGDGRMLGLLAWRELASRSAQATQFEPEQSVKVSGSILEQRNPWGGVAGCIYYGGTGEQSGIMFVSDRRASNRQACVAMRPSGADEKNLKPAVRGGDAASAPPQSLDVILADLDNIRLPWKDLYRAYTEVPVSGAEHASAQLMPVAANADANRAGNLVARPHGPNQLDRLKHKVDAGFNVHLTIDPGTQALAQRVSQCYAGDAGSCKEIGLANDSKFGAFTGQMYEKAAVRMAAVAVIDIATGKIDALGSAHTDCYRQEFDGPGRNARGCPDLPTTPHYEPDRLLNHALFTDALPGSIIKPIMATAFLRDPVYRRKIVADRVSGEFTRLQDELKSSDSAAFLNRMFCVDQGWMKCDRPHAIQDAALLLGWDAGCFEPSFRCGRLNVLFGYPDASRLRNDSSRTPLGASVMYGRLLTESVSAKRPEDFLMMRDFSFDPKLAAACSRGDYYTGDAQKRAWRKCRGGHLVYVESEGWGQGNARTTALGAAGMLARLAAAANGQAELRLPHLVDRISDAHAQEFELAAQQFQLAGPVKLDIAPQDAALILNGMISHKSQGTPAGTRTGTAHGACARVFDAATCNRIDWIAGKTGTPPYGNDGLTLKEIRSKCRQAPARNAAGEGSGEWLASCSREQPYKWYIAVFRTDDGAPGFNKAIAVLTERNWYRSGPLAGKVQSPGDHDEMNVSAELAFRIMERMRAPPARTVADTGSKS